jgi:ABC-type antimicrobial peptide transport system permease subunit
MIQKIREISIRRVMGSDIYNIIFLFSRDFIIITSLAFIVAAPISYFWIAEWLDTFEVKLKITLWDFILPYLFVLFMAIITIGFIVHKTAHVNPSDNLRSE